MDVKDELLEDFEEALDRGMSQVRADGTRELDVHASVEYLAALGYRKVMTCEKCKRRGYCSERMGLYTRESLPVTYCSEGAPKEDKANE